MHGRWNNGVRFGAAMACLLAMACVPGENALEDLERGDDDTNGSDSLGATSGQTSAPMESETAGEMPDEDEPETTDGCGFFCPPDVISGECDVWAQDCPEGEKCMPWANDGGNAWNATKCVPLDTSAAQPGDSCTVEGSGVSGVDDCEVASMCWNVDSETNEGTCIAFCTGNRDNPVCDDPGTSCAITNGGVLILCLPSCDPLLQDCEDGEACYGIDNSFVCAPDASGDMGLYGDPCEFINACDAGLACVNAMGVPGCNASSGCCSTYCDLDDAGAGAACQGAPSGQDCVSWFEENNAPPGFENVGICFIPQ